MSITREFWEKVLPLYSVSISEVTLNELGRIVDNDTRKNARALVESFEMLTMNDSIIELAQSYIENGIFPQKYFDDALHVAVASYHGINYLVSWNFTHLVKVRTRKNVNAVNVLRGVHNLEILSPQEL